MAPGSPAGAARRWLRSALALALVAPPAAGLTSLTDRWTLGAAGPPLAAGHSATSSNRSRLPAAEAPVARFSWKRSLPSRTQSSGLSARSFRSFLESFFGVNGFRDPGTPNVTVRIPNATLEASGGPSEGHQLNFVRINSQGDTNSLRKALILSSALASGFLALFSILRCSVPEVYTRAENLEELGWKASDVSGCMDWFNWVWTTTPEQEVEAAGLDGWSVIAFYRLACNLFSLLGFFLMTVLIPLHWVYTPRNLDTLSRMDIGNLPPGCPAFWVHALMVWIVVLAVNSLVLQAHRDFSERRFTWLKDIPEPRASTLMVENIPQNFQSDEALKAYFVDVFREEAVVSAYIVRKTPKLRKKLQWLTTVKYQLLVEESRWERLGAGQSEGRARVAHFEHLREEALRSVAEELAVVEKAVQAKDTSVVSSSGFVTFSSEFWQRLASKEQYRADVDEFAVSMPPDPEDVQWQDLAQGTLHSRVGELLGWACLVLIFLFWSPVVAFISTLTTLENLARMVPALSGLAERHPSMKALVEGFLATASLKLFLSFLPNILMLIIRRFFTLKAGTLAQLRLQRWYYAFLLIFVLMITLVGRGALLTATDIARNPGSLFERLATTLPTASHFYLSYVVLGWFTVSYEALRTMNVIRYAYLRFGLRLEKTAAKEYSEPEDEDAYGVGSRLGMASLMCSITLVFCACTPLILACASVYFFLGRLTYGYVLVHAETKKPDLGGHVFFECLRQVIFVLFMYVLLMTGVLLKHSRAATGKAFDLWSWTSPPAQPVVAALALAAVYWAWRRLHSLAWDTLPLEEVIRASRAREAAAAQGRGGRRMKGGYVQRECDLDSLLEDAEKVAKARAQGQAGFVHTVNDYVRPTGLADLLDLTNQVTWRGTDVAGEIVDRSLGAVDLTVTGLVHYGARGAAAVVDKSTEAASKFWNRTFRFNRSNELLRSTSGEGSPALGASAAASSSAAGPASAEPGRPAETPAASGPAEEARAGRRWRWPFRTGNTFRFPRASPASS